MSKQYIGDGAYVDFIGENVVLTTENGISTTNRIVLEPEVMATFLIRVSHDRAKRMEAQRALEARRPWDHPEHKHDEQCAISCNTNRTDAGLPRV